MTWDTSPVRVMVPLVALTGGSVGESQRWCQPGQDPCSAVPVASGWRCQQAGLIPAYLGGCGDCSHTGCTPGCGGTWLTRAALGQRLLGPE